MALTRTDVDPDPSVSDVSAVSSAGSKNSNVMPLSTIRTATDSEFVESSDAVPVTFRFSPPASPAPSARAVKLNVPEPLTCPAGMVTSNVAVSTQASSVVGGHDEAKVAALVSPAATAMFTVVSEVISDPVASLNPAVTVIECAAACSTTVPGDADTSKSSSDAGIVKVS